MKIALVTTTINVPHVLKLYRTCSDEVAFFVAGDEKTPHANTEGRESVVHQVLGLSDSNWHYYGPQDQRDLGCACSDLIGWNTISRRNIAILEALKWGAEIIVTIDDDNIPMSTDYFDRFEMVLGAPFSGPKVTGKWFDAGMLLYPPSSHRGFPHEIKVDNAVNFAIDAKVGVAAGMCLGDPDISAVTRIAQPRYAHFTSELLRAGIVVDPGTKTVFNSQNTAFLRELAPCFLMVPQFRRYDDIFASLIAQRVMRETGHVTHFGQPFVWQQRNAHNLLNDLDAETWGMRAILPFADWLNDLQLVTDGSVLDNVRRIYDRMEPPSLPWMLPGVSELGQAWCDDIEKVL